MFNAIIYMAMSNYVEILWNEEIPLRVLLYIFFFFFI